MRHVISAHSPLARLRVDRVLDARAAALPALGAIVMKLRPHVERAELQTAGESLVELELDGVVLALAHGNVAILDCLVLRERPQRLGDNAREALIRRGDSGRPGLRRIDFRLKQPWGAFVVLSVFTV